MTNRTTPDTAPGSRASAAESQLLRVVGTWGLAAGIVNVTIGGGIFRLPAGVYATLGSASPFAYFVCAILMALIVVCFAEAGSRVSLTGGLYAYVETAFGPLVGFVCGVLLWAGMTSAISAVAVVVANAIGGLVPALGGSMHIPVVVVALTGLAALNIAGVGNATRFNAVMTVAKLAPLAILIVVGLFSLNGERIAITETPSSGSLARASILLIFAFLGVESALVPSGEVKDPSRTVPRAIALALTLVVVFYLSIQLVVQSALGPAITASNTPVAEAGGALLGPGGRTLILVGAAVSMFGYLSGMMLAVPRMLFAFGRDGFLFKGIAAVHPRFRTPHVAIIVQAVIAIVLAATGEFERLAVVANGAILVVYAACALAALQLRRKDVRSGGEPFVAPLGGTVPVLAFLAIIWLMFSLVLAEWIALLVTTAAALAIFAATRRSRAGLTG